MAGRRWWVVGDLSRMVRVVGRSRRHPLCPDGGQSPHQGRLFYAGTLGGTDLPQSMDNCDMSSLRATVVYG